MDTSSKVILGSNDRGLELFRFAALPAMPALPALRRTSLDAVAESEIGMLCSRSCSNFMKNSAFSASGGSNQV